eukprot:292066_1
MSWEAGRDIHRRDLSIDYSSHVDDHSVNIGTIIASKRKEIKDLYYINDAVIDVKLNKLREWIDCNEILLEGGLDINECLQIFTSDKKDDKKYHKKDDKKQRKRRRDEICINDDKQPPHKKDDDEQPTKKRPKLYDKQPPHKKEADMFISSGNFNGKLKELEESKASAFENLQLELNRLRKENYKYKKEKEESKSKTKPATPNLTPNPTNTNPDSSKPLSITICGT